ncbi:Hypothetical protein membrane [Clostridium bornimense]|uniref:Thioredoxin domain-containing protein n=1 Tax=Clostridium bornimense TaxID=1216932 RepID=W6S4B0_9CLOT|nr:thioredoxin family protein [Clostridium bornimense]CDM69177.1 Hypothetical protein membrane [Clostridium bornimense]
MKKKYLILIFALLLLLVGLFFVVKPIIFKQQNKLDTYEEVVSNFEKLDIYTWNGDLSQVDKSYVYFGRSTCPDCQDFVPKLKEVAANKKLKIFYIDTEDNDDETLKKIREDLSIDWVPTFGYVADNKLDRLDKEKDISVEDIENFISKYDNE